MFLSLHYTFFSIDNYLFMIALIFQGREHTAEYKPEKKKEYKPENIMN